jgi:hypothetical protein
MSLGFYKYCNGYMAIKLIYVQFSDLFLYVISSVNLSLRML